MKYTQTMHLEDNYEHVIDIFYIEENIPGPTSEEDPESVLICEQHNSQVISHCRCFGDCTLANNCSCITTYGCDNYSNLENAKVILDENKFNGPIFECNSMCSCSNRPCSNRLVQYGPIKHLEVKNTHPLGSAGKGLGLFTNAFIPKGSFICEYAGEVITKAEALKRHSINKMENNMNYIFCLNEHSIGNIVQTIIDPSKFGNIGRYANHSCDPNCCIVPVRIDSVLPKLAIFSLMDIAGGSEITFNYGSSDVKADSASGSVKCLCGSINCRKWLPSEDYL